MFKRYIFSTDATRKKDVLALDWAFDVSEVMTQLQRVRGECQAGRQNKGQGVMGVYICYSSIFFLLTGNNIDFISKGLIKSSG